MKTITPWPVFVLAADQSRLSVYAPKIELKLLCNVAAVEIACSASSDRCVLHWNDVNFECEEFKRRIKTQTVLFSSSALC
jgi:hypothetical protein